MKKILILYIFLLSVVLFSPLNSYSQNDNVELMTVVSNNTSIDIEHLYVKPSNFSLFLITSFVIIAGITFIVINIVQKYKKQDRNRRKTTFLDVIRDGDYYPSLPRFQFLVWTFVISFVYLSAYLIRIYSGKFDAPYVDNNLLILLGISIVSPLLSNIISGYKYKKHLEENDTESSNSSDTEEKSFKTMLFENDKPALFRYQMFLWTFIGIFIFVSIFSSNLYVYTQNYIKCQATQETQPYNKNIEPCKEIESLTIPKIDSMLVVLMGLSQSGYLGGKIVSRTPTRITKMFHGLENKFIILGINFGERNEISSGTILINGQAIAGHNDKDVEWFDTKIQFLLPDEYKDKSFKLLLIIDDVIFIESNHDHTNPHPI